VGYRLGKKKVHFADLVKDANFLANFELDGMTSQKHGPATKYSFKIVASRVEVWASFELNFFRVADTLEADSLLSGKTPWLLAIGGDKKVSFLE